MMKPRKRPEWPADWPEKTAHDRARRIATVAYAIARKHAPASELALFEELCRAVGEADWLLPTLTTRNEIAWMTRDDVATRGGVRPNVVSDWTTRGLTRGGETVKLTRYPEGYDPAEVTEFLRWRDTTPRTRASLKGSRACLTSPRSLSSAATAASARRATEHSLST